MHFGTLLVHWFWWFCDHDIIPLISVAFLLLLIMCRSTDFPILITFISIWFGVWRMNFKGFLVSGMHFYGKQNLVPFLHNSILFWYLEWLNFKLSSALFMCLNTAVPFYFLPVTKYKRKKRKRIMASRLSFLIKYIYVFCKCNSA